MICITKHTLERYLGLLEMTTILNLITSLNETYVRNLTDILMAIFDMTLEKTWKSLILHRLINQNYPENS